MVPITELLEKYQLSEVRAIDINGDTILHLIVKDEDFTAQEKIETLKKLLDNGLDLHSKNKNEETILQLAIKNRSRDVIDFLLERKVDLDNSAALYLIQNEYSKLSELKNQSWSCEDEMQLKESESASFLEWMVTRGLDIDRPNRYTGKSALFLAIDYSLHHLLPVLFKYTKNIDYVGFETKRTLLHIVLGKKAKTRWSPSYSRRYALDVVKILLDRGVSPESSDKSLNTALHLAIANYEDFNVVQMLIDHTTYLNYENGKGETPLSIAISRGSNWKNRNIANDYWKICQSLMMKCKDHGKELELRPLHIFANICSCSGREEVELFQKLINIGCNVNAKELNGHTPLHIAVAACKVQVVKKLIENGANINSRNGEGATPLHLLFCNGADLEIAIILLEQGANVNAKDNKGYTALHKATSSSNPGFGSRYLDRIKLLLDHGADFSALSDERYSVLHIGVLKFDHLCSLDRQYTVTKPFRQTLEEVFTSDFFSGPGHVTFKLRFLLNHWVKLYAAKLECRMGYPFKTRYIKNGLRYYPESRKIYEDCMKEIKLLKNTFIGNYRTSIYAFLHMDLNSRRAHVHNEELDKFVHSPAQLEKQFPHYAILIISSYNETIRRKSLMEPAKKAWKKLSEFNLGDLCIEHIFSFLSNAGLYNLIEASGDFYSR